MRYLLLLLLACACGNPSVRAFCELGGECTDPALVGFDPVPGQSEDSVEVCVVNQEASLQALRLNSEEICHDIAAAREAYFDCVVDEGCDAMKADGPCGDEFSIFVRLVGDAQNKCAE